MLGIARDDDLRRLGDELRARQGDGRGLAPLVRRARRTCRPRSRRTTPCASPGSPADDPALVRARERVLALGGAERARFFTKLWLAVQGRYPWSALPVVPPEMILLPPRAPLSPYRFACWARGTFVALMVVLSRHPILPAAGGTRRAVHPEPPGAGRRRAAKARGARGRPGSAAPMPLARAYNRRPLRRAARAAPRPASPAGSATGRRPTARGAASSRRGSTRSSRCTRWATRSTTR